MRSRLPLIVLVFGCAAGVAQAQPVRLAADTNGDGQLSSSEFGMSRRAAVMGLDTDHDGKVSTGEWARQPDVLPGRVATRGYPSMGQGAETSAFSQSDIDGDGALTSLEIDAAARQQFIHLDANRDGVLAGPELETMAAEMRR